MESEKRKPIINFDTPNVQLYIMHLNLLIDIGLENYIIFLQLKIKIAFK